MFMPAAPLKCSPRRCDRSHDTLFPIREQRPIPACRARTAASSRCTVPGWMAGGCRFPDGRSSRRSAPRWNGTLRACFGGKRRPGRFQPSDTLRLTDSAGSQSAQPDYQAETCQVLARQRQRGGPECDRAAAWFIRGYSCELPVSATRRAAWRVERSLRPRGYPPG
jgi:hypothetical protein